MYSRSLPVFVLAVLIAATGCSGDDSGDTADTDVETGGSDVGAGGDVSNADAEEGSDTSDARPDTGDGHDLANVADFCARTASCAGTAALRGLAFCHDLFADTERNRAKILEGGTAHSLADLAFYDCLVAADGDCAAVRDCVRPPRVSDTACDGNSGYHLVCDEDVVVTCPFDAGSTQSEGITYSDCAAAGLSCVSSGSDAAQCSAEGPCRPTPSCRGDLLITCSGGVVERTDCRDRITIGCSGTCTTNVSNTCDAEEARCAATGDECDDDTFVDGCEGDTLVTCNRSRIGSVDCSTLGDGFTCVDDGSMLFCGRAESECDFNDSATCDGTVITYCHKGQFTEFDCASIGSSRCETRDDSWAEYVVCAPD